ncbi:MAG: hypothetical protein ABIY63_13305 [Fibrobacteria bacterium]
MSFFLRQSTASQSRIVGPFVDDTDFKTLETALSIANTDVKIMVNGGASANKNSGGGTHRANGHYSLTFDATDTATVGEFEVAIAMSGALVVKKSFRVLEEVVYDALFAAAAPGFTTDAIYTAGINAITTLLGTPAGASMSADIAAISAGSGLDAAATRAALGLASANLDTQLVTIKNYIDTEVAAIKAVTDLLPNAGALSSLATASALTTAQTDLTTLKGYVDTEVAAILAAVDTEVAAIKAVTDALPNGGALSSLATASALSTAQTAITAIKARTDNLPTDPADASDIAAAISGLNNLSAGTVLAQVNAALDAAIAELGADPGATPTIRTALMLMFMNLRNASTTTASAQAIKNNAGTSILSAALADDGTTFTKAKFT